jgi:hypothetical protein
MDLVWCDGVDMGFGSVRREVERRTSEVLSPETPEVLC